MFNRRIFKVINQYNRNNHFLLSKGIKLNNCCDFHRVTYRESRNFFHATNLTLNYKPSTIEEDKHLTEQEFLVKLKNDPDVFGSAGDKEMEPDEGDLEEERYFTEQPTASQKLRTKQYADIIKDLIRKRKLKEAIDVVEIRMIKEDRVKPENYIYNLLLGACGRVGYTKKAFMLFNDMKKRGLLPMGGTYTALFNACANSPWPEDGLTRAKHLRNLMIEKMHEPNETTYNSMIKAFGRCNDLNTAFQIADEMAFKKLKIKDDTLAFLLQACINDKDAGFRHALLVWRKFYDKRIKPSIYNYNLMLKCIRECGLGDIQTTEEVIKRIIPGSNIHFISDSETKLLESGTNESTVEDETQTMLIKPTVENTIVDQLVENNKDENIQNIESNNIVENRPNLMARIPHLGNIITLSEIVKPEDRLMLVGGMSGFLKNMEENNCPPDIKTFTQLLGVIPSTISAEIELLKVIKKSGVKKDIDFYNMLIKKRSMRFDFENAKDVVRLIKKDNKRPDLITYGVLAMSCKNKEEALDLIEEMNEANYRLNKEILGAMLHQACYNTSFPYIFEIMDTIIREEVQVSKKTLEMLQEFKKKCKNITNDPTHRLHSNKGFQIGFKNFRNKLKDWLPKVQTDETEELHPWQQFRQTSETDVRHYKVKGTFFKPRHTSLFRQKTADVKIDRTKKTKGKVAQKQLSNFVK